MSEELIDRLKQRIKIRREMNGGRIDANTKDMQESIAAIEAITAERDALAAKLAAANSFYARDIGIRDKEISVLREKTMARFANDDCWIFQGDGNDHLESLVCPVAIMPAVLSAIIKERDALAAELKALREIDRDKVRDAIADALGGMIYCCTRQWSAWAYGTMSQNDFVLASEDDGILDELTEAAISALSGRLKRPEE